MAQEPLQPKNRLIVTAVVVAAVIVLIAAVVSFSKKGNSASTDTVADQTATPTATATATSAGVVSTDETASPAPTASATTASTTYKDGTYSATGTYSTPGGSESIAVKVTLAGDVVTDSTVTGQARGGDSQEYQSMFISSYKQFVTGKNIDSISLSRVSGSSLTSGGFNKALTTIKSQAKS